MVSLRLRLLVSFFSFNKACRRDKDDTVHRVLRSLTPLPDKTRERRNLRTLSKYMYNWDKRRVGG